MLKYTTFAKRILSEIRKKNCWRLFEGGFSNFDWKYVNVMRKALLKESRCDQTFPEKKNEEDLQMAAGFLLLTRRSCLGVRGTCPSFHQHPRSLQSHPTT
jgi:hypothetical protein